MDADAAEVEEPSRDEGELDGGETAGGGVVQEDEASPEEAGDGSSGRRDIETGKEEYNKGNYEEALKSWQRSLKSVKYMLDKKLYADKPDQLQEVYNMEQRLWLNLSQGFLKVREWNQAVDFAEKVLAKDPENTKALYRKAQGLYELNSFTDAFATAEMILKVEPENAAAKALLNEMRRGQERYKAKAKKLSKKMIEGIERDPRSAATQKEQAFDFVRSLPLEVWEWLLEAPSRCRDWLQGLAADVRAALVDIIRWARRHLERLSPGAGSSANGRSSKKDD